MLIIATYPKLVLVVISIIKSDDVGMAQFMKDINLHGKIRKFLVRFNTADFGSCVSVIFSVSCFVNFSEGSISQFSHNLPESQGIDTLLDMRETLPLLAITTSNVKRLLDTAQKRHFVVISLTHQNLVTTVLLEFLLGLIVSVMIHYCRAGEEERVKK